MFTETDYDKLQQIMEESPQKKELLTRLLESHRMEISSISHELRNPLTLVYSTLQIIEASHPEVIDFRHWKTMRQDIEYINVLLEELSSYNNGSRLHFASLDASSFLKTLVLSFAASLADTDISFTSRIEPNLPHICADSVKLREILLNLLGNARDAVHAMPVSTDYRPAISLCASLEKHPTPQAQSNLIITVTDNGCGIHPEDQNTIFEPFVTKKANGTGLGLAIAKRIAAAHKGTLTVSSDPGSFTTFQLTLPIQCTL